MNRTPQNSAPRTQRAAAHGGSTEVEGAVRPEAPHDVTLSVLSLGGKRRRLLIFGHASAPHTAGWPPNLTALQWALLHRAS